MSSCWDYSLLPDSSKGGKVSCWSVCGLAAAWSLHPSVPINWRFVQLFSALEFHQKWRISFSIVYSLSTRIALAMPKSSVPKYSKLKVLPSFCVLAVSSGTRGTQELCSLALGHCWHGQSLPECTAPRIQTQPGRFAGEPWSCEALLHKSLCCPWKGLGT